MEGGTGMCPISSSLQEGQDTDITGGGHVEEDGFHLMASLPFPTSVTSCTSKLPPARGWDGIVGF